MTGHCSLCEVEEECGYLFKPCDCCNQRKFVAKSSSPIEAKLTKLPKKEPDKSC